MAELVLIAQGQLREQECQGFLFSQGFKVRPALDGLGAIAQLGHHQAVGGQLAAGQLDVGPFAVLVQVPNPGVARPEG